MMFMCLLFSLSTFAHPGGHHTSLKKWHLQAKSEPLQADFIKYEKGNVWLSNEQNSISVLKITDFSAEDQRYILEKHKLIESINSKELKRMVVQSGSSSNASAWAAFLGSMLLVVSALLFVKRKTNSYLASGIAGIFLITLAACTKKSDTPSAVSTTVPANVVSFMQGVYGSFAGVTTTSDGTYLKIASNGLPSHNMMVGITNWQQQVPVDQAYTGTNSWSIPITPVLATTIISTKTNLLSGALAIAANGIPIFNPLNNRGEDAKVIGELDQWGGHCGKADDYHYHIPPTHLQATVGAGKPIAYALDGFPLYGTTTETLDECLGKFNADGSYQYHTINTYPYFIANMRGKVTLDPASTAPETRITPQATAKGVRPPTNPLTGAAITGFQSTGTNAYSLTYTLNSQTYTIAYNWNSTSTVYNYRFTSPNGAFTTATYQR